MAVALLIPTESLTSVGIRAVGRPPMSSLLEPLYVWRLLLTFGSYRSFMEETTDVYGAPVGCQVWDWVLYVGHPHGGGEKWRLWDARLLPPLWCRVGCVLIMS